MQDETTKLWKLRAGVEMSDAAACEVANIACALKSLSTYAEMAFGEEGIPEDLQKLVDEGMQSASKLFEV